MKKLRLCMGFLMMAGSCFAAAPGTWFLKQITDAGTGDTYYIAQSSDILLGKQIDTETGDTYYVATTTQAWAITAYNAENLGGSAATNYVLLSGATIYATVVALDAETAARILADIALGISSATNRTDIDIALSSITVNTDDITVLNDAMSEFISETDEGVTVSTHLIVNGSLSVSSGTYICAWSTSAEVQTIDADVYVPIEGIYNTTFGSNFSRDGSSVTYIGNISNMPIRVHFTITVLNDSANVTVLQVRPYINGVAGPQTPDKTRITAASYGRCSLNCIGKLNYGDIIQIRYCTDDGDDLTPEKSNLVMHGVY